MGGPAVRVRGLLHLALRVRDLRAAVGFYTEAFGMRVVWAPDECNVYLSSGTDNLALHEAVDIAAGGAPRHPGFVGGPPGGGFTAAGRPRGRRAAVAPQPPRPPPGSPVPL